MTFSISTIAVLSLAVVSVICLPVKDSDSNSREHIVLVDPTLNPTIDADGSTRSFGTTKTFIGSSIVTINPDDSITTIAPNVNPVIVTTISSDLTTRSARSIGFAVTTLVPLAVVALL